jgi:hypothetical protein
MYPLTVISIDKNQLAVPGRDIPEGWTAIAIRYRDAGNVDCYEEASLDPEGRLNVQPSGELGTVKQTNPAEFRKIENHARYEILSLKPIEELGVPLVGELYQFDDVQFVDE